MKSSDYFLSEKYCLIMHYYALNIMGLNHIKYGEDLLLDIVLNLVFLNRLNTFMSMTSADSLVHAVAEALVVLIYLFI